jgi:endonuclease/exonuclease/phosphatase family metal-dependent hydrolase
MLVRVMTYNVHSCIGTDGRLSPRRIASVIARSDPDIVGLQELDAGLERTGKVHQAEEIATALRMDFHFHPSFRLEEGGYGNAVLSRYPIRLKKAGRLPGSIAAEERGAVWVETALPHTRLNAIFTHFGLDRRDRVLQAEAIMGEEWAGGAEFLTGTAVVGGDLNAVPGSGVHRIITSGFRDVRGVGARRRLPTWPSRYPVISIDHLFVGEGIVVKAVTAPSGRDARSASDHLPLIADLVIP